MWSIKYSREKRWVEWLSKQKENIHKRTDGYETITNAFKVRNSEVLFPNYFL